MAERILLVDDTPANLALLSDVLEPHGYELAAACSGEEACELVPKLRPDLILLDLMMPGINGYETCTRLRTLSVGEPAPVIFVTARQEATAQVEGFRVGGVDYITKPFQAEEVLARVKTHLRIAQMNRQLRRQNSELLALNKQLREEMDRRVATEQALQVVDERLSLLTDHEIKRWGLHTLVGKSAALKRVLMDVKRLQSFAAVNVLITGESGTGKELVARAIHYGSKRARQPFVPVNCVAIPNDLAERMFFGQVGGGFAGAGKDHKGFFELADGGTLFLDEVGSMPWDLQGKLLRVLEDGCITPLGSAETRKVNVRIVAAGDTPLVEQLQTGVFRQDTYFRLAQFVVEMPPLRARREDIELLAEHFLTQFATEMGVRRPTLSRLALARLQEYEFPGNIRELKHVMERALIETANQESIQPEHLYLLRAAAPTNPAGRESELSTAQDIPLNLEQAEAILTQRALAVTKGNIAQAARLLGVNRARIYRRHRQGTEGGTEEEAPLDEEKLTEDSSISV